MSAEPFDADHTPTSTTTDTHTDTEPMSPEELEMLMQARQRLAAAGHGGKAAVVAAMCERMGCTAQTLYRKLQGLGAVVVAEPRKTRSDKGRSGVSLADLRLVSGLLNVSTRANEKKGLTVRGAVAIAQANGLMNGEGQRLSAGRVGALLRANHLHRDQLRRLPPAQRMRSEHPNQTWQIDASVCVLYFIGDGNRLKSMPADQYYKNKPQNLAAVANKLCTRYACTDHRSGTIWVRYYTGGETAENLVEFFFWCVTQREKFAAHGVPWQLMLDPGSANTSGAFVKLCERLGVKLIINKPGNPRAKGQVEQAHHIIERNFEGRLRLMPSLDLDLLNAEVEAWQVGHNWHEVHTRHRMTRYANWLRITPEQLRIAPPIALMRELVSGKEETRHVNNNLEISFAPRNQPSRMYDVRHLVGVGVGQTVVVVVNAYRSPAVDVRYIEPETGEIKWLTVQPIGRDKDGFDPTAPVIGKEYARPPLTVADRARQAIGAEAYPGAKDDKAVDKARRAHVQAYAGVIDAMADVAAVKVPAAINKRGTPLEPEARSAAERVLSVAEACMRLKTLMGEDYSTAIYAHLRAEHGDKGVPEAALAGVMDRFGPSAPVAPLLRVVGGGL